MNRTGNGIITSHGYIKFYVGLKHHLSDSKGYAYEHRIVAEKKLGRRLKPNEIAHHVDHNKQNNSPENIQIVNGNAEHYLCHRKTESNLKLPNESNPTLKCKCGCGQSFKKFDSNGRPRQYVSGHNPQRNPTISRLQTIVDNGIIDINEIDTITDISKNGIKTALSKMVKNGTIVRIKRGVYGPLGSEPRTNYLIDCACGCGEKLYQYDKHWRKRKYVIGHNLIGKKTGRWAKQK